MPETKLIPTVTSLDVIGSIIKIFTQYFEDACDVIQIFIANVAGILGSVLYKEGELVVEIIDSSYPDSIDFFIDTGGSLVATGTNANRYLINSNGELICNPNETGVGYDEIENTLVIYT